MAFVPVIFGGHVNGYSIARTFFETYGIKSVICDYISRISKFSNFVDYKIVPNPKNEEHFLESVMQIGSAILALNKKPIIIVTNDIWLIPLSKYRDRLAKNYAYSFSEWGIIKRLTIKNNLYSLADSVGVLYPKTKIIKDVTEVDQLTEFRLPILIKPVEVVEFIQKFPSKKRNVVLESHSDLNDYVSNVYQSGFTSSLVIQEYIPSGIENLYTATTYSDQKGKVRGVSVGHKLTQYPPEAGTITSGLVSYVKEVEALTVKLLESVGFFGIANTEFKYDERDGKYYLMEVNPRPGMWNYSSYISGLNLFEMLIDDLNGQSSKNIDILRGENTCLWTVAPMSSVKRMLSSDLKHKIKNVNIINPMKCKSENIKYKLSLTIQSSLAFRVALKIIKLIRRLYK